MTEKALIIGAGSGLSRALAETFHADGMAVGLAARDPAKLDGLAQKTGAKTYACDASSQQDVETLFAAFDKDVGAPDVVVFNPSYRVRGPFVELDPLEVEKSLRVTCYAGFLVGQAAAKRMLAAGHGTILFTGASASVKGYPQSAPFAMGKFGLRGLAQSMARELHPQNIHIGHFVIDGGIDRGEDDPRAAARGADGLLRPEEIARTYLHVHRQHRGSWTWEIELRPWGEKF
ncbi:MAG: SDR family NAD(P)-dependent oxidoreductase [Rhodospirillales bacterium]